MHSPICRYNIRFGPGCFICVGGVKSVHKLTHLEPYTEGWLALFINRKQVTTNLSFSLKNRFAPHALRRVTTARERTERERP